MFNEEEKGHLTVMPTLEEVKRAVVDLNAHGAPGPDGYGAIFFQTFWEIVREDAFNAVKQFVLQDWMFPGMNSNVPVLIPKNVNASTISDYRPIAQANFRFKTITKILVDSLAPRCS